MLNFRNCLSCVYNCDDLSLIHYFFRSSNIWIFIYSLSSHHLSGYIYNSLNDQLPDGLMAQLVERCTGIAEVMGSNPVQAWIFFRLNFRNCLSCVNNCDDLSLIYYFFRSSNIWIFIYSLSLWSILAVVVNYSGLQMQFNAILNLISYNFNFRYVANICRPKCS